MKVNLAWKVVVGAPEGGIDYSSSNNHFNIRTSKTFLRKIGGITNLDFFPYTLEPTNILYKSIAPCKIENGFSGKKFPFKYEIDDAKREKTPLNIKIHSFSNNLVILSISVNSIEFKGSTHDLLKLMRLEHHTRVFSLVRILCGLISSGGRTNAPSRNKPKTYPYFELLLNDKNDVVSDKDAVELLTRHKNPKPEIVENVIVKNKDHQLDSNNILIDRQGILAIYTPPHEDDQHITRKFESSHYLFELAISLSNIIENRDFFNLNAAQQNSISKLIHSPSVVFNKSVTAYKTWLLLINEFRLKELYEHNVTSAPTAEDAQSATNLPLSLHQGWSDKKKWYMSILSALLFGLIAWIGTTLDNKFDPFSKEKISLFSPSDGSHHKTISKRIDFDWSDVNNVNKYILFIERYDSESNDWLPQNNEGRYVLEHSEDSVLMNNDGRFRWQVIARDTDEEVIGQSVWYHFYLETEKTPQK